MAAELLLDTGALVSLLDHRQSLHRRCGETLRAWAGPVVSSEAVLTEACHLLARTPRGRATCIDFFLRGAALLLPLSRPLLSRIHGLIEQYADLPMDFADATLVAFAEQIGTDAVMTTDRRDFEIYRIHGRRRFRILPD